MLGKRRWHGLAMGLAIAVAGWMLAGGPAVAAPNTLGARITVASGSDPDVAMDANGDLHVVYVRDSATYYQKVRYPSGQVLVTEKLVGGGSDPQVAVDSKNNPHVVMGGVNYGRWNGSGFTTVQAMNVWRTPRLAIDKQDRVFIVGARSGSPRDLLVVFQNGAKIVGETVVGEDSLGGIDVDSQGAAHITSRDNHILWYTKYVFGTGVTVYHQQVKTLQSDCSWIAVNPLDDTLDMCGTRKYGTSIDYVYGTAGNWGAPVSYGQGSMIGEADVTWPTIDVDGEGYKYMSFTGAGDHPYYFVLGPNRQIVGSVAMADGSGSGLKFQNPNIDARPDWTGAFITWGQGSVYIRSIGDVARLRGSVPVLYSSFDFNKDGKADRGVFSPSAAAWFIEDGRAEHSGMQWGAPGMVPVPADYDGDGICDVAVFSQDNGAWQIQLSKTASLMTVFWGSGFSNPIPVPGDYNNDGCYDLCVFVDGYWFIYDVKNAQSLLTFEPWGNGLANAIPVPGDYNNDGNFDLCVYVDGFWFVRDFVHGQNLKVTVPWGNGLVNAIPVPGNFTGDATFDLCVYSEGWWFIKDGRTGSVVAPVSWGYPGTIPVAGDFGGTDADDFGIYDPVTHSWAITGYGFATPIVGPYGFGDLMPVSSGW